MVLYKDKFYGWKEVSEHTAECIAKRLYNCIMTKSSEEKMRYINSKFQKISFSEKQLKGESV